jgi:hypothetical protein
VTLELQQQSLPAYLRLQADRCRQLSRSCMDLGPARDPRLMAEEYCLEASKLGMGMKIIRSFVERIGGALQIGRCENNQGTRFTVQFS